MSKELKGLCNNCLGCNKLEDKNFKGTYKCKYATTKQLSLEEIQKEMKNE